MKDRRCVVVGVGSRERVADGFAQIAVLICLPHAFFNRLLQRSAGYAHILPQLHKNNRESRILADGDFLTPGDIRVLDHFLQHLPAGVRLFRGERLLQRFHHVFSQNGVGFNEQRLHGFGDFPCVDPPHAFFVDPIHNMTVFRRHATCRDETAATSISSSYRRISNPRPSARPWRCG